MLRGLVGDEAFWAGIRSYYRAHQDGHATTADFRREMERASGRDLRAFFDQWLTRGGVVRLGGDWSYRADTRTLVVRLVQRDQARTFSLPLQVGVYTAGRAVPTVTTVQIAGPSHEFQIPVAERPDRVVLDPNHFVLMESAFVEAGR
jgi:aminopeptidase N